MDGFLGCTTLFSCAEGGDYFNRLMKININSDFEVYEGYFFDILFF